MSSTHQSILDELYDIDPSLREHETELLPLIERLLARDPAQKPSPAFVRKLRGELRLHARATAAESIEYHVSHDAPSAFAVFFNRFAYATAGAIAAVIVAVPTTIQFIDRNAVPPSFNDAPVALNADDGRATAETAGTSVPTPVSALPVAAPFIRNQSGGGGDAKMAGGGAASLVAPWNPVRYRLEGDLPALPSGNVTVLSRARAKTAPAFSAIADSFRTGAIDLSSFGDATVDSLTVSQREPFGYTVNLSAPDGTVSINQAWERWPHPENDCRDDACYQRLRTKLSDIPADAELIRIAGAFMKEHAIDLSQYGEPTVDDGWRDSYDATEDKTMAWIPDAVRVVYPLLVDGKPVIEAGGEPTGISVQVSVRHKRVSDAWGITTYSFDESTDEAVSDRAAIEAFLDRSGGQTPEAPIVALRDPAQGFVRVYSYEGNASKELFVPALIFRVQPGSNALGWHPRSVAVPLSRSTLDEALAIPMPMPIDPMPMPRPMEGGGPAVDASTPLSTGSPAQEPLIMEEAAR